MAQNDGFYCKVCDCTVKDSINYLEHCNGKKHNKNLGISLKKFTDSTFDEVKEMYEKKKRELAERLAAAHEKQEGKLPNFYEDEDEDEPPGPPEDDANEDDGDDDEDDESEDDDNDDDSDDKEVAKDDKIKTSDDMES